MKLKQAFFIKNYSYLLILSIVISLSAFSCSESEEIILEEEKKELFINFVNESDYDLRDLKMNNSIQLPDLAKGEETGFIKMDKYTEPYSAKINHKLQDTVGRYPAPRCGNEIYIPKTEGKYTVVLTVELGYYDYIEGENYYQLEFLQLFTNSMKE